MKVTMDAEFDNADVEWKQTSDAITPAPREIPMSYAEAKEIALCARSRRCWEAGSRRR
jgi:hypothetical protein